MSALLAIVGVVLLANALEWLSEEYDLLDEGTAKIWVYLIAFTVAMSGLQNAGVLK